MVTYVLVNFRHLAHRQRVDDLSVRLILGQDLGLDGTELLGVDADALEDAVAVGRQMHGCAELAGEAGLLEDLVLHYLSFSFPSSES